MGEDLVEILVVERQTKAYFHRQAYSRRELVKSYGKDEEYGKLYNLLVPEVLCAHMVRVGTEVDGGKWVCNPFVTLPSPCAIYSLGMNNEISFEVEIQELTQRQCRLHAYDMEGLIPFIAYEIKKYNADFHPFRIAVATNDSANAYSIPDLIHFNGDREIEILKVDIEGAEFKVLLGILNTTAICQIIIEIHADSAYAMVQLLRQLSQTGFYLFSYEINGFFTTRCEFSFIHERCLAKYGLVTMILARYLS